MSKTKNYVERNGKVYARISYTDSAGKRRQIWRRAETKTDAKDITRRLEADLSEFGVESFEHDLTLGLYLDRWLKSLKQKVSERTYGGYESLLKLHVRPVLGTKRLSKLRPLDFQSVIDAMAEKKLSPRTIRYAHTVTSSAMKQAVRWKVMTGNPAQFVELPKSVSHEMQYLSVEQAKKFLRESLKDEYGLIFEIALVTGMRPEEYLALQWEDINFPQKCVSVKRTLVRKTKGGGWYFGEPKTKQSRRLIPLPDYLVAKLKEHRRIQLEYRLKQGEKYKSHDLVFATLSGTPISMRNLDRRHFKCILAAAKLPNIRLYDLRHTCATLLLVAGEHPKVVSERLGHANIVLTLQTYTHVLPTMQKSATEKLSALLAER